jgi:DNA processing protein
MFRASARDLEPCHLPAPVVQAIVKKEAFKRAEKELAGVRKIAGCALLNWTEPESSNQPIKQGAKLVNCAEDVIKELPTSVRTALGKAEQPEAEQPNLLVTAALNGSQKKLCAMLSAEEPMPIDDIVERSGLNSSEVLATLFDLEMKGIVRQSPGKQFSKVLL